MIRVPFTIGSFDCITLDHIHLVKEMRKIAMPNKRVVAFVPEDYACFIMYNRFPVQSLERRISCLSYFLENIDTLYSADIAERITSFVYKIRSQGGTPVFVNFDDDKEFPGREILRELEVSVRFIKKPRCKSQE